MTPLSILRYQGEGFSIGTNGASFDLFNTRDLRLEGVLLPRFTALDDPDSLELGGSIATSPAIRA